MLNRLLILLAVSLQLTAFGYLGIGSIPTGSKIINTTEVCYSVTMVINNRTYLYQYSCEDVLVNVIELND